VTIFQVGAPGLSDRTSPAQPPATTFEQVSAGGSPTAKTFSAFTDPGNQIKSYSAVIKNTVGSTSISGSGLGAYTFSSASDGDSFTLELHALDGAGKTVATANHCVDVAAAGGGGFTDGDLHNITLKTVDLTDGTWTLHDPDSLIKSVTFASGRNVITGNALSSGSNADLNWKNSGNRNAPRWYKNATIGSNNVNRGHFTVGTYFLDFDSTRELNCDIVVGLSRDADAGNAANLSLGGAFGQVASNSVNASYGVYAYSGATSLSTGGPDHGLISFLHGGNRIGGGVATLIEESGGYDASNNAGISRTSNNQVTSGGQPLQLVVGIGLRLDGTAWTDGHQVKIGVKYLLMRPDIS